MDLLERQFDTAFDAPDGIKKLRELILTLAMQGKLVLHDPKDQPTSELLKSIEREKQQLVKNGKLKNSPVFPSVTEPEETFNLPKSWAWARLGAVSQHNSGKTLDGGRNSGTPRDYITTSNLYWGRFELDNVRQMLIRDEELGRCTAKRGDLLVCEGGEAGRAAVWMQESEVCFQNHIHRVRFYGKISPYYGYRFFEYLNVSGEIEKYRKGVGISNMSSKSLASIPFPLPPVAEQLRIIERIDELMARCDALEKLRAERDAKRLAVHSAAVRQLLNVADADGHIQAREFLGQHFGELYTVKQNVTELRRAILQLGVTGKFVSLDSKDSSIVEVPLKDLAQKIGSGSTPSGGKESYVDSGIPLIRSMNVHFEGFRMEGLAFIDKTQARKLDNVIVQESDVLLNITGASIGRVTVAPPEMANARVNQHVCIIRANERVIPRYLEVYLASPLLQRIIDEQQVGATREALTKAMIERFLIPLPSLETQSRIVAKIDQLMSLCDTLEQQIDAAGESQSALRNAMMAQYGGQRCV